MTSIISSMKKIALLMVVIVCAFCFCSCEKESSEIIDYGCVKEDSKEYLVYRPENGEAKFGLIFYVGTAISPSNYEYLGKALASHGYALILPKVKGGFSYVFYEKEESAFSDFGEMGFFVGGHSQGGGAAVRRAQENKNAIYGVILYAPLCYGEDTLSNVYTPTLLIEATLDNVLTEDMKIDAKKRLPVTRTQHLIEGCHMSFSSNDSDAVLAMFNDGPLTEEQKAKQKELTVEYTLAFMDKVTSGLYPMPLPLFE